MGKWVTLTAADGHAVAAYVATPAGQARAGVVVAQEIFGVNAHIQAVADGYAEQGYLAVAPATFQRVQADVQLGYSPEEMAQGAALKAAVEALPAPGVLQDIQAAVDWAQSAGRVAMLGYCWGGLLTWRSASLVSGLSAAVTYYGGGMTQAAEAARQAHCPVLAHFGHPDRWIPLDTVQAFARTHPDVQVHVYEAPHGFNCDHRAAYQPEAARLAAERTLAFLAQHLG
jgi:carboxymethylenebutenolidase